MEELNRRTSTRMRQGRNRGVCRNIQGGSQSVQSVQGICNREPRQGRQANMPPPESVIQPEGGFKATDLQMLKEQALRMAKALKAIEDQIKALTEG